MPTVYKVYKGSRFGIWNWEGETLEVVWSNILAVLSSRQVSCISKSNKITAISSWYVFTAIMIQQERFFFLILDEDREWIGYHQGIHISSFNRKVSRHLSLYRIILINKSTAIWFEQQSFHFKSQRCRCRYLHNTSNWRRRRRRGCSSCIVTTPETFTRTQL